MYILIGVLSSFVESFWLYYLLKRCFGLKKDRTAAFYLAIILDMSLTIFMNRYLKAEGLALPISMIYEVLISTYLFRKKSLLKAFYILLYNVMLILVNLVIFTVAIKLFPVTSEELVDANLLNSIMSVISILVIGLLVNLFLYFYKKTVEPISNKYIIPILMIPVVSICFLYILSGYSNKVFFENSSDGLKYFTLAGIVILNIYACYSYTKMQENENNCMKIKLLNKEIGYYNSLSESYSRATSMKHDYEKHLNVMNGLLQDGKYTELGNYLTSISKYMAKYQVQTYTGDAVIDCILSQKSIEASEDGINMFVVADKLAEVGLNPMNLCILIGNILDNAIEECRRVIQSGNDYTYIRVKLSEDTEVDGLIISVANSSTIPKVENGSYLSKKGDSSEHGIGLKNINRAVEEMNGICTYGYEQEVFNFIVRIPLKSEEIYS